MLIGDAETMLGKSFLICSSSIYKVWGMKWKYKFRRRNHWIAYQEKKTCTEKDLEKAYPVWSPSHL